jgi:hypothetical protein
MVLYYYVDSPSGYVQVYRYNPDGVTVDTTKSHLFVAHSGWNALDLSTYVWMMHGYGFVKARLVVGTDGRVPETYSHASISEAKLAVQYK